VPDDRARLVGGPTNAGAYRFSGRALDEASGRGDSRGIRQAWFGVNGTDELVWREDGWVAGGGSLRTYLGIAPGVGKTFAMLAEGRRRAENGERVVVGWIESHGRPETSRQLGGLEVIAPRTVAYRGAVFADFDAPAAIASGPLDERPKRCLSRSSLGTKTSVSGSRRLLRNR
jgi:osmosensitive K+ channel His kinase sensor protein